MADSLRLSLSISDVYHFFGVSSGRRGDTYQRNKQVLSATLDPQTATLTGKVTGKKDFRAYDVTIRLTEALDIITSTDCSCPTCPVSKFCKHGAALVFHVLRAGAVALSKPPIVPDPPVNSDSGNIRRSTEKMSRSVKQTYLSSEMSSWIASLDSSQESRAKISTNSHGAILYLLDVSGEQRRLALNTMQAKREKTGWGKLHKIDFDKLLVLASGYVTEEDMEIATLFMSGMRDSSWRYRNTFPQMPEICQIILPRLLATERCYWKDITNKPLRLGTAKQGTLEWETRPDAKQVLRVHSDTKDDIAVIAGLAWYVNLKAGMLGPLVLPGTAKTIKTILSAPPVEPSEALAASQALVKIGSLIPPPRTNFTFETQMVAPIPCLTLTTQDRRYYERFGSKYRYGEKQAVALLSFDYGKAFSGLAQEQSEYHTVTGNKILIQKKDMSFEPLHLRQLEQYGLQRILRTTVSQSAAMLGFPADNEVEWFKFNAQAVPHLKELGWQVNLDKSFQFEVVVPEEEWSADATEGSDFWFSLDLGITVGGKRVPLLPIIHEAIRRIPGIDPLSEIEGLNHHGTFYAPLADGRHAALPFDRVKTIIVTLIELFDQSSYRPKTALDVSLPQIMELTKTIGDTDATGNYRWSLSDKTKDLIDKVKHFQGLVQTPTPKSFAAQLRPYQSEGLAWLNFLREFGLGGILADDMGLGKTVQTLAHIAVEKRAKRLDKPFLVVCPTSVLPNWISEIERFTPTLKVTALWGPARGDNFQEIPKSDIVVTTYPLVVRDVDMLAAHQWKAVVLDESQTIKNPDTLIAQAVGKLRCDYRVCLTGTPVENHLGELWSQFNFLMPGFLKDLPTFTRTFRAPIEKQKSKSMQKILASRVRPFLLRRTKELVAKELPEKTIIVKRVELEGAQRDLYETVRLAMYEKVKEALSSKGLAQSQIIILDALLKLRQVCCDPRLVSLPAAKTVQSSAKLELLLDMVEELLAEGKKILLFSQFTSMLDLIVPELTKRKIDYVEIRGDTKDRSTPVQQFQNGDVPLFLLSLKAGGFGLNLTAADTVIHYDPWWNPAVESQATDRAHRIGQEKSVFVFKLIASGTIEERLVQLQERKKAIAEGVYDAENGLPFKLTAEDLESLFSPLRS